MSAAAESFREVLAAVRREIVVQGSRFIADVIPIRATDQSLSHLETIRKEFHAATHHCWAYRVGVEKFEERFADDGEPAGTAGRPILQAIERHDVTNVMIVVTRYFGGTKLGTGGLARAYADAANAALDAAEIVTKPITRTLRITCSFDVLPKVKSLLYRATSDVHESFEPDPVILVTLPRSSVDAMRAALTEATRGKALVQEMTNDE
jgi:uncharacterized YigZ family protein